MGRVKDLSGLRFGRLVVRRQGPHTHDGKARWYCSCDCGSDALVRSAVLRRGGGRSCGCLANELTAARSTTHGLTGTKEWIAWRGMFNRCRDERSCHKPHYADRGIAVCKRWERFEAFLSDMGVAPSPGHTVDRIDNDLGYQPGNCRWATITEQNRNKRSNVRLTLGSETLTSAEWARRIGITQTALRDRLKRGWSVESALTTPPMKHRRNDGHA